MNFSLRRSAGPDLLLNNSASDVDEEASGVQHDASTDLSDNEELSQKEPLIKLTNGSSRQNSSAVSDQLTRHTRMAINLSSLPAAANGNGGSHVHSANGIVRIQMPDSSEIPLLSDAGSSDSGGSSGVKSSNAHCNGLATPVGEVHRYKVKRSGQERAGQIADPYPRELKKTVVAALFALCNFLTTAISLSVIHESVPRTPPLPDHLLDYIPYQQWALTVSEILISIQVTVALLAIVFHPHRFIVMRRVLLIQGLLYGYRAITMFVTVLPPSDQNYMCAVTLKDQGQNLTVLIVMKRAVTILSGFGLSMNGKHIYCGDYIFSGHTMTLILAYLVIQEYTSRRLFVLHWIIWLFAVAGVGFLLMGRGHYTIDVIIAYWITTRLWFMYHSMACQPGLKKAGQGNYFARIWWWCLFRWFEENVRTGPLPNGFSLPLSRKICQCLRSSSRDLVNETSRLTRRKAKMMKQEA